ncbi:MULTISPECIES: transposase [unclassified Oceanispirochaeta]|uniref:transposase n=1 Tax=unclassified Oceanispirochaeta TaxID=2635722 RepID=UPI000E099A8C|nr:MULTISPECIES: transposase [unclassified Oceanispirochaeta]MBF9018699.1 transposase [Oceanispirochaeta sp. M2]NPD75126.1 transposase [Oceanispirochaeta sp. M1]RDG29013.1 IS110 family transposase [Oceanispirochaeta sp. M1]
MKSLFYVGMDVHKDSISIAVLRDNNKNVEFERQIRNEPARIKKFFNKYKDESLICCYEAGPTGFALYRQLEEMNITCYVAAPSLLPRKPGDRIKTDKRDALMLAKVLRNQEIVSVYVPSTSDEAKIDLLKDKIDEIAAEARYVEKVSKLRCFKGIDTLTALTFIAEIGDFRRFRKAQNFMSYLGLVPSERSSGNQRRLGSITKAGNSRLRKLLIESSWHYKHYGPSKTLKMRRKGQDCEIVAYADKAGWRLNKKFKKLNYRGKVSQKIVTAIARKLSGFIWGMMLGNTDSITAAQ